MARTVFDNAMVRHVWAQQTQSEGRSYNGNCSFRGPDLISYSTVIASFVNDAHGGKVCLITTKSYSITTTGKHMPRSGDIPASIPVFHVPNVQPVGESEHLDNLAYLVEQYNEAVARMTRARDLWQDPHHALTVLANTAYGYSARFNLPDPALNVNQDVMGIVAKRAERAAKNADPATIEKRARDAAKRLARKGALEVARVAQARAKAAEAIAEWRAGDLSAWQLPYEARLDATGGAMLRISTNGMDLETSQGASVPLKHAIRVFQFVKSWRETARGTDMTWRRNGHTIRVGQFTVDQINADGSFRAGCHKIHWSEIENVARLAGVLDIAPSMEAVTVSE
jgi:hypothetical protein